MVQDRQLASQQRLLGMLEQLDDLRVRINRLEPVPGSPADADIRAGELTRLAWQHGTMALVVACDALRGLRSVASAYSRPVFAHMPLLRTAVDGGAFARWLFDPSVDEAERLRRGLRVEEEDLLGLQKAQRHGAEGSAFRLPVADATRRLERFRKATKLTTELTAIVLDHVIVATQDAERYAGFGEP